MYAARDPFEEHADDFAWCEDVIRRNSHSFYRAFSLLPPRKRNGVFAVYAFCRAADDCVDVEASRERLDGLQRDLERFDAGGMPRGPLWRALGVVFGAFDEDTAPFFDMLEGQRRDLAFRQPADLGEFLSLHFLTWVGHFLDELADAAEHPFYEGLARLTRASLDGVQEALGLEVVTPRFYR